MTDEDDIDGLAGEYVLGSLDSVERNLVDARRKVDSALFAAIEAWQRRLAPLSDLAPEVRPPEQLLDGILARVSGQEAQSARLAQIVVLRRNARRWRTFATGAGVLAAGLALMVGWLFLQLPATPTAYVAALYKSGAWSTADEANISATPAFLVTIHPGARTLTVYRARYRARPASTRSYQLWLMRQEGAPPISLGVISQAASTTLPWPAGYSSADLRTDTLAVSLENEGSSRAAAPTGPILFAGKPVPASL